VVAAATKACVTDHRWLHQQLRGRISSVRSFNQFITYSLTNVVDTRLSVALAQLAADLTDKTGSKLVMPSANDCYSHSAADRGARSIVMSASVCLCVCLSAINHIFGSTRPIFTELFMRVTSAASVSQSSTSLNISYLLRPR